MDREHERSNSLGDSLASFSSLVSEEIQTSGDQQSRDIVREDMLRALASNHGGSRSSALSQAQKQSLQTVASNIGIQVTERDLNIVSILKNEIASLRQGRSDQEIVALLSSRLHDLRANVPVGEKRPLISTTSFKDTAVRENELTAKKQKLPVPTLEDPESDEALKKKRNLFRIDSNRAPEGHGKKNKRNTGK